MSREVIRALMTGESVIEMEKGCSSSSSLKSTSMVTSKMIGSAGAAGSGSSGAVLGPEDEVALTVRRCSKGSHSSTVDRSQRATAGTVSAKVWETSSVVPTRDSAREKSSRARAVSLERRDSASEVTRSRAVAA